jgi:phosphoenolpyruvate carboxylase
MRAKEELQSAIKYESNELKTLINLTKDESSKHKEELQLKYDDKLRKIKEVCASYFSKYETELSKSIDKIKELD